MITDWVIGPISSLINLLFSVLPVSSLAPILQTVDSATRQAGTWLAPWNTYLPLTDIAGVCVVIVSTWLPTILIYKVFNWAWRHTPTIFGLGLGSG